MLRRLLGKLLAIDDRIALQPCGDGFPDIAGVRDRLGLVGWGAIMADTSGFVSHLSSLRNARPLMFLMKCEPTDFAPISASCSCGSAE